MNTIERSFPGVKESVPQSRAWVGKELELAGVASGVVADAVLVLSELVTNAVVHSCSSGPHGSVLVRVYFGVSRLRLEVTDAGGVGEPRARRDGHRPALGDAVLDESGHGLALVEAFATRWWTRGDSRGRTVCAELVRTPATA